MTHLRLVAGCALILNCACVSTSLVPGEVEFLERLEDGTHVAHPVLLSAATFTEESDHVIFRFYSGRASDPTACSIGRDPLLELRTLSPELLGRHPVQIDVRYQDGLHSEGWSSLGMLQVSPAGDASAIHGELITLLAVEEPWSVRGVFTANRCN